MNITQLELATIRAQLMDKYNDIMASYIYMIIIYLKVKLKSYMIPMY